MGVDRAYIWARLIETSADWSGVEGKYRVGSDVETIPGYWNLDLEMKQVASGT